MAKTSRSASIGDSLHVGSSSCESLVIPAPCSPSFLTNTPKALPLRAVRPRVCQHLSSPSRSASSQSLLADPSSSSSSSSSSSTDLQQTAAHAERPRAAEKADSVASDAPDDQGLHRRRSSSVMLLPLPLCFSPFFSLSSSRLCVSGEFRLCSYSLSHSSQLVLFLLLFNVLMS